MLSNGHSAVPHFAGGLSVQGVETGRSCSAVSHDHNSDVKVRKPNRNHVSRVAGLKLHRRNCRRPLKAIEYFARGLSSPDTGGSRAVDVEPTDELGSGSAPSCFHSLHSMDLDGSRDWLRELLKSDPEDPILQHGENSDET